MACTGMARWFTSPHASRITAQHWPRWHSRGSCSPVPAPGRYWPASRWLAPMDRCMPALADRTRSARFQLDRHYAFVWKMGHGAGLMPYTAASPEHVPTSVATSWFGELTGKSATTSPARWTNTIWASPMWFGAMTCWARPRSSYSSCRHWAWPAPAMPTYR